MQVGSLLLGGFFGTIGVVLVFIGRKFWGRYRAVTGTPTTDVRQVDERGLVELKGTVKPAEDPFTSPLGGVADTVVAGRMARDWNETGDHQRWSPQAAGIEAVPFRLDDGTGEVLVEVGSHTASNQTMAEDVSADDVTMEFEHFETVGEYDPGEEPAAIQDFVARHDVLDEQTDSITNVADVGHAHGARQYREGQLRVGEEAYVLGVVEKRPDVHGTIRPENAVVRPPAEGDDVEEMILGDLPEGAIAGRARLWAICLPVGAILTIGGLAAFVYGLIV